MVKVWGTELRYRLTSTAMDILGRSGASAGPSAPAKGQVEQAYRHAAQSRFTGGTNEVQRTIIAERGLGLPRQ